MGVPTSAVGYTAAMSRREDHEVRKDMWWGHWTKKQSNVFIIPMGQPMESQLSSSKTTLKHFLLAPYITNKIHSTIIEITTMPRIITIAAI